MGLKLLCIDIYCVYRSCMIVSNNWQQTGDLMTLFENMVEFDVLLQVLQWYGVSKEILLRRLGGLKDYGVYQFTCGHLSAGSAA